jgi:hypothetical protein
MVRRYLVPCLLVVAASMLIALVTYASGSVDYVATCSFQETLPLTAVATNPENLNFQARQASIDVGLAGRGDVFVGPAKAAGMEPSQLSGRFTVTPINDTGIFSLSVNDSQAKRAGQLANGICANFVTAIRDYHTKARDDEVTVLRQKIGQLQDSIAELSKTPATQLAPADLAYLEAQKHAVVTDQQLLANTLSSVPPIVTQLTTAGPGIRHDTRNLSRNLIVGGIGALLACFLVILVGEIARDSRSRARG